MDTVTRVQIMDEAVCISHSANTFGKGMNPTILSSAIGKYKGSSLVWQLVLEKKNSKFKLV